MGKVLAPDSAREQELSRMMRQHGSMLVGLCSALLKDAWLAQDVVQETFVRAWRRMDDLRGGQQSEKAWLCRIAINLCRDQQRTRWLRMVDKKAELDQAPLWYTPKDEAAAYVMEAVGQLSPRLREVRASLSAKPVCGGNGLYHRPVPLRRIPKAEKGQITAQAAAERSGR